MEKTGRLIRNNFLFAQALPCNNLGRYVLMISVLTLSSLSTLSYYGSKCFSYLFGAHHQHFFNYFYVFSVILGAVVSISAVINLVDGMYALMAILNMITALLLAPKVRVATKKYFGQLQEKKHQKVV